MLSDEKARAALDDLYKYEVLHGFGWGPICSSDAAYAETYSVVCNARRCYMILVFCAGPRQLEKLEKPARQRNGARYGKTLRKEKIHGRLLAVTSRKPATNSRCVAVADADIHTGAYILAGEFVSSATAHMLLGHVCAVHRQGAWYIGILQEELDRLRKQAAERRASHAAEVSLAFAQATAQPQQPTGYCNTAAPAEYQPEAPPQNNEELLRTLKVSWDKQDSIYTTDELRQIMSKHGPVEDVVLRESKSRKKGSALIVMQDLQSARAASEAVNGSLSNPLLAVPLAKAAASSGANSNGQAQAEQQSSPEAYAPAEPQQQHHAPSAFPLGQPDTTPTPPSSPVKVRNPFGGSAAVDHSGFMQPSAQPQAPAFGAAGPASNANGFGFGAGAPAARPLFAAGASMSSNAAGHFPAGPFGFGSGSYSSFPSAQNGAAAQPGGFGHAHFGPSVQAGVKRQDFAVCSAVIHQLTCLGRGV